MTLEQSTATPRMGSGTSIRTGRHPTLVFTQGGQVQSRVSEHIQYAPSGDRTHVGRSFFPCARFLSRH